jgi:hypothetical protein
MNSHRIVKSVEIAIVLLIIVAGFVPAVLYLWNWLVPSIFGLRSINFWEALGLLGLSWLLFGGFRGCGTLGSRRDDRSRGERLTPEQRALLRQGLHKRCTGFQAPAAETES